MNVLIVSAHPDSSSLNARLVEMAASSFTARGSVMRESDLYRMNFEPRESEQRFSNRSNSSQFFVQNEQRFNHERGTLACDVSGEIEKLLWSNLVIVQFPLWWFGAPAILKGWIDRVFVYGGMYSSTRRFDTGACRGKRVLLSVTTGSTERDTGPGGREGDIQLILWPILYAFRYVGFDVIRPFTLHDIRGQDVEVMAQRDEALLARYGKFLRALDAAPHVPFNVAEDWDGEGRLRPGAPSYSPFIRHI